MSIDEFVPTRSRFRNRTILVPLAAAAVVSAFAAYHETGVVGRVLSECDLGIGPTANGFVLMVDLVTLWFVQAMIIGAVTMVLPIFTRRRLLLTGYMVLATLLILTVVAWLYFSYSGLPFDPADGYPTTCTEVVPQWWPTWLPSWDWGPGI